MSDNPFNNYRDSYVIRDKVNHPKIIAGEQSYYSGYYHGHHFEDCVKYLDQADKNKNCDRLIIGKYCSIASGAVFMLGGNHGHRHDWIATYPLDIIEDKKGKKRNHLSAYELKGDMQIGNDVWIGYEAMLIGNVKIGDGAVIAARAVVTKDVPPYAIVGGNPAKIIKYRFSKEQIVKLLQIKWWDWERKKILDNIEKFRSCDVEAFDGL